MSIREEFFIERQGRRMVLYAGLLEEAHDQGLVGIETDLVQIPKKDNGDVAIARAKVLMRYVDVDGVVREDKHRAFAGIGDASAANVGKNIAPHIIRMAETRAKARALRDAINVGVASLEEMGDEGPSEEEEHAALIGELEEVIASAPEGAIENPKAAREYAAKGVTEARLALQRAKRYANGQGDSK